MKKKNGRIRFPWLDVNHLAMCGGEVHGTARAFGNDCIGVFSLAR
jgi:hypothetical protein